MATTTSQHITYKNPQALTRHAGVNQIQAHRQGTDFEQVSKASDPNTQAWQSTSSNLPVRRTPTKLNRSNRRLPTVSDTQLAIQETEQQIFELTQKLNELRAQLETVEVPNYTFSTSDGSTTLLDLFGEEERLLAIHNMGQACRYCTLWADGFNGFLPHLESAMAVALLSKDDPGTQRRFATSRGWNFRMASHAGTFYLEEQSVGQAGSNYPGAVIYHRRGDRILRGNTCVFGPGDLYCSMWNLLGLAGIDDWTPQFRYWSRPDHLEDGGENVLD